MPYQSAIFRHDIGVGLLVKSNNSILKEVFKCMDTNCTGGMGSKRRQDDDDVLLMDVYHQLINWDSTQREEVMNLMRIGCCLLMVAIYHAFQPNVVLLFV